MIINGNLDLSYSSPMLKSLGELVEVKKILSLTFSSIESLGKLKKINSGRFSSCQNLKSLENLEEVKDFLVLNYCKNLKSLGKLKTVKGNLDLRYCSSLKDLGELKIVKKIYLFGSGITKQYIKKQKSFLLDKCDWEF